MKIRAITNSRIKHANIHDDIKDIYTVSVFFWHSRDDKPLIIQLGSDDEYYITNNGIDWKRNPTITPRNLLERLDGLNCTWNHLHLVNIEIGASFGNLYFCAACQYRTIDILHDVSKEDTYHYTEDIHTTSRGYIGNIKRNDLTILSAPRYVNEVHLFWRTGGPCNPPLLCYEYEGSKLWFKRHCGDLHWRPLVNRKLSRDYDPREIQKVLKKTLVPRVTINLKESRPYNPAGNTTYFGVSESITDAYVRLKHTKVPFGPFTVKNDKHGQTRLNGIKSGEKLESISAFYDGHNPIGIPLLIELKSQGGTTFKYYKRSKNKAAWTELNRPGEDARPLVGEELRTQLERMKSQEEDLPTKSPQKLSMSSGSETSRSHNIGGIIVGTIGTSIGIALLSFAAFKLFNVTKCFFKSSL
ncbi:hypothetical protein BEWA_026500 [Theileria equi strain WA]|uniref:Uncharacterized protein n=1 Tax=Theileria equi strain WA TaxID=1537102 RepID=L0AXQ5_THEEQ|nr:hypothetical protein BEWA_026500 [Theileria equi strain WA]AFZ79801.1 hypothetical protein BEWA_026500 [Theileria equi strain WA]|eukprot:XP_004829467.1 hypothetical protein BEWA_026500 [Theileria equi strain WA]